MTSTATTARFANLSAWFAGYATRHHGVSWALISGASALVVIGCGDGQVGGGADSSSTAGNASTAADTTAPGNAGQATNSAGGSDVALGTGPTAGAAMTGAAMTGAAMTGAVTMTAGGATSSADQQVSGAGGSTTVVSGGNASAGMAGSAVEASGIGGSTGNAPTGACSMPEVRVTEVDVGGTVVNNESEEALMPLAIAARPSGGSRLAWMGSDDSVHVAELDVDDQLVGSAFALPAHDFQDIGATDSGGVLMLTRAAEGGGTLNCGTPANLCDGGPNPAIPCFDMWMVGFEGGSETWATRLTTATSSLPPYSTGPNGETVHMIWWYQHQGRIATDGTNWAGYFCDAISISENSCINIHQGDRMQVVGPNGGIVNHPDAFPGGCSHSGYTRIVWDETSNKFVMVCKTDNNNRIAMPSPYRTIFPVDLGSSNMSNVVTANGGGYWLSVSNQGSLYLVRFSDGEAEQQIVLGNAGDDPHLARFGESNLVAGWEEGGGDLILQVRDAATGAEVSATFSGNVPGNRWQGFRAFPDGSVAYAAPGSNNSTIRIMRVMPCE